LSTDPKTGLDALLTPEESVLFLIEHQPFQFANPHSHGPALVVQNVVAFAKTAKAFGIPTVLTTVIEERGGYLIKPLQDLPRPATDQPDVHQHLPGRAGGQGRRADRPQEADYRRTLDRGLRADAAIQALSDGYQVYVVTDGSGGTDHESHERAVQRMVQAGVVPVTWMVTLTELQQDWAREETVPGVAEALAGRGSASGIAFGRELQLLATPAEKGGVRRVAPSPTLRSRWQPGYPPPPPRH
jgi:nicotinamidase-related amidase